MTETVRINRRKVAKAATREKVMAAAQALWERPGSYEETGIRDIAAKAGMSTGAVFANFDSKADLWRAVMGYAPPVDCPEVRALLRSMADAKAIAA